MQVALTGGAGFVGRKILENLSERGVAVRALQHRHKVPVLPGVTVVPGSLDDADSLAELLAGADALIHAGGVVAARRPEDFHRINADGARRLFQASAGRAGLRLLLISSLAARRPDISPYAASKRAAEDAVAGGAAAWDILRPPAVYGPGDLRLLPLLRMLAWRLALLPAGPSARVSLIHVDDLARAAADWALCGRTTQATYEIDDGGGHAWRDVLERGAHILGKKPVFIRPPAWILRAAGRLGDLSGRWSAEPPFLTSGKIAELLQPDWVAGGNVAFSALTNWKPDISLAGGLAATLDWYKQEGLI